MFFVIMVYYNYIISQLLNRLNPICVHYIMYTKMLQQEVQNYWHEKYNQFSFNSRFLANVFNGSKVPFYMVGFLHAFQT